MSWHLIGNLRGQSAIFPPGIYGDDDDDGGMGTPGPAGAAGPAGSSATPITAGLSGFYTSSDTVANNTTWVFNLTATLDDGYLHSGTKLVAPAYGFYLFNAYVHWDSDSTGIRVIEWRKNGSAYINGSGLTAADATADTRQEVSAILLLNAGDYLELTGFQNSGGSLGTSYAACSVAQAGGPAGPPGPVGMTGEDADEAIAIPGAMGPTGAAGAAGAAGAPGQQGALGMPGEDADEAIAVPGVTGAPGAPGAQGSQGPPGPGMTFDEEDDGWRFAGAPSRILTSNVFYPNGSPLGDNGGNLYYSSLLSCGPFVDASGNIYFASGSLFAAAAGTVHGNWQGAVISQTYGGTGINSSAVTNGQLLIGNSTGHVFALGTLTAGSNISITSGPGSITIAGIAPAFFGDDADDNDYHGPVSIAATDLSSGTTGTGLVVLQNSPLFTGAPIFQNNTNGPAQWIIENRTGGTASYSDLKVVSDVGEVDFFVTSSLYTGGPAIFNGGVGALNCNAYDLWLGTQTNNNVHFYVQFIEVANISGSTGQFNALYNMQVSGNVGFYGKVPAAQPVAAGTTAGFTGGSGAAVQSGSTFTGGSGTSAYTLGDIVLALKQLGLIAS
jgi:hypothetical protein